MTQDALPMEWLAPMRSIAFARIADDGALQWANEGFRRLLPDAVRNASHLHVAPYLLSPRLDALQRLAGTAAAPCYRGLLTIGDPEGQARSLRGHVRFQSDGWLLMAEHDIEDIMRVSDAAMRLSADLAQSQRELIVMNRRLSEREAEIHSLSVTDQLTGVGNRRQLDQCLEAAVMTARTEHIPFSLVMIDIDHFKAVNDVFGHAIGDRLLQHLARTLQEGLRNTDTVCRFGGEEFAIVMPDCDLDAAGACSEAMRTRIAQLPGVEQAPRVTATFGVAQWREGDTADSLLQRADDALYQGKSDGRNRVVCADAPCAPMRPSGAGERSRQAWPASIERRRRGGHWHPASGGAEHSRGGSG
ncbi:GGDEF domain-containing protein [Algiphilus sp.]|uniref:GGDEF domain-containing protein n=1 Tax=Algiphilus sp. TaxID=1872431 RepID=UPI003B52173F